MFFMSQTIIIKIGGMASRQLTSDFLQQVVEWKKAGHRLVIVHGGGFAINKLMADHSLPVKKINGLRITRQSDMELIHHALIEQVGAEISQKFLQESIDSIQLKASLSKVVKADFLDKERYGYVGKVKHINNQILNLMLENDFIPILASLGYNKSGEELNINADYLARAVAAALSADKLILMTDVAGVLENGQVISSIKVDEIQTKIEEEVITAGMIPKIESAAKTVLAGVRQVLIGDNLKVGTVIEE